MTEGMAREAVKRYDVYLEERERYIPPSSVRRSKRLIPRPFDCASRLAITGGSCLWSPMSATCWDWQKNSSPDGQWDNIRQLTPFIRGMREAGSVDIEASSKKTTGKSMMFNS